MGLILFWAWLLSIKADITMKDRRGFFNVLLGGLSGRAFSIAERHGYAAKTEFALLSFLKLDGNFP